MNLVCSAFLAVALSVSSGRVATAQDFDMGLAAYQAGNFVTALEEFRPLAEQGDAAAQFKLGRMYSIGAGVPQDLVEAVKWYRLSAEQGYSKAQFDLGDMYDFLGSGPLDYAKAARWYLLAAEQGHNMAQNFLGLLYENGTGVLQDNVRAHMWFNIAGANGLEWGVEHRDDIADEMTPADISQAQAMARECMSSGYSYCGW